ncbi:GNAT family N-acetyltransferase [Nocardia caishijiensis]|uniref:RimJ/RimL family protein N-acetyltransferase n=1 Tax=Nocardia caishijiensis TaxID=184756 RepID=A0ABQ6YEA5_9NOCA|nr:GNAT family protein [Nocardia caishijiensis]KAF0835744.1 RimJ/RimL family protein N-acetyltransferase [Nocardia caishijiensis]
MPAPVILHGRIVRLEPLAPHHVPGLAAAALALRGQPGFTVVPHGDQEARTYVFQAEAAQLAGSALAFAIVLIGDECVVGATRFTRLDYWQGPLTWPLSAEPVAASPGGAIPDAVEIGNTWLTPAVRGGQVNLDSKLLLLTHAFDTWRVRRVTLRADARNLRSRAAIERLGAVSDGVRRAHSRGLDGEVRDTAFYSILRDEWPGVRERINEQSAARAAQRRAPLIPPTAEALRALTASIG